MSRRNQLGYVRRTKSGLPWLLAIPVLGGIAVALYFAFNKAKSAYVQATRTPQDILWAVEAVDPVNNPELQPGYLGAGYTWCNKFMVQVLSRLGIELPWNDYGVKVNELISYIDAGNDGWYPVDKDQAQALALQGHVAVATYYNLNPPPHDHGHMALVLPIDGPMQIAQAGNQNFNQGSLAKGFGLIRPIFYAHD